MPGQYNRLRRRQKRRYSRDAVLSETVVQWAVITIQAGTTLPRCWSRDNRQSSTTCFLELSEDALIRIKKTPILYTQPCVKCNRFIIYTTLCKLTNILYTQRCAVCNRFIIYTTDQTTLCICNEYLIYTTLCSMQQIYYIHNVVQMQLISYIHNVGRWRHSTHQKCYC